jgi:hypothetical protein
MRGVDVECGCGREFKRHYTARMLRRHVHRPIRWATLLALVLATLAPSVAHALRHARGEWLPLSVICSATGSRRVQLPGQEPGHKAHTFEHCAACAVQCGMAPPAPLAAGTALRNDLAHAQPHAAPTAAPAPQPNRQALARAPPQAS